MESTIFFDNKLARSIFGKLKDTYYKRRQRENIKSPSLYKCGADRFYFRQHIPLRKEKQI